MSRYPSTPTLRVAVHALVAMSPGHGFGSRGEPNRRIPALCVGRNR